MTESSGAPRHRARGRIRSAGTLSGKRPKPGVEFIDGVADEGAYLEERWPSIFQTPAAETGKTDLQPLGDFGFGEQSNGHVKMLLHQNDTIMSCTAQAVLWSRKMMPAFRILDQ